jgi:hypothetical protein
MCFSVSCERCAAEIAEDSQFCRKCGHGFGVGCTSTGATAATALVALQKPTSKFLRALFVIAAVVIILFLLFGIITTRPTPNKRAVRLAPFSKQQHHNHDTPNHVRILLLTLKTKKPPLARGLLFQFQNTLAKT